MAMKPIRITAGTPTPTTKGIAMTTAIRRPQVCVLGSAELGSTAYALAGDAGERLGQARHRVGASEVVTVEGAVNENIQGSG